VALRNPLGAAVPRVVQRSPELDRILALPRRPQEHDAELARALTQHLRRPGGTQTLRPIQATALHEAWRSRGLFGPIGVGEGKTLISLLIPVVLGWLAPILILPAKLVEKTRREMVALNRHWKIPNHLRIYSYELLGRADHVDLLRRYPPCDGLVADEAHKIRNPKAAVTRRVRRFLEEHRIPFVALSGTITKRSIRDYEHLLRWALRDGSPLPHHYGELEDWADALDEHDRERPAPGMLVLLSDGCAELGAVRRGYQRRLVETPGVVASVRNRIGASLLVRGVRYPQGPAIRDAFARLRNEWELPDGTPLVDGMEIWRHARELALGFWGRWDPPAPPEWLAARSAWSSACRAILAYSRTLDSPDAVVRAIDAGQHRHAAPALEAWRAVRDTFVPNPVPVWICEQPLEFALEWGRTHDGIIWCDHVPFGRELAKRSKWTYYGRHGMSDDGQSLAAYAGGTVICSRQSGGEGFNLQAASEALVTAVVANGVQTEQLLGRLHRPGQDSDVTFDLMLGCREHLTSFWKSFADARFVGETTGDEQKLTYADIDVPVDVDERDPQWQRSAT
jgi:hypothetical protein